jgi:hypothetical protein
MLKLGTRLLFVATAATLAACQPAPQSATPAAPARGTYTFEEHLTGEPTVTQTTLTGEIRLLRDTVLLYTQNGSCRLVPPSVPNVEHTYLSFDCSGFWVSVDPRDPLNRSRYSMTTSVMRNKTVCIAWGVDAKGNPICIQTGIQSVPSSVTRSGYLHFHVKTS